MSLAYEYRRLSPEEREAVVRRRSERGYPLHAPPHPFRQAGHYMITAAHQEHVPLMSTPERRTEFDGLLLKHLAEIGEDVVGWVILPNHYHVEVGVQDFTDLSSALQHLHGANQ